MSDIGHFYSNKLDMVEAFENHAAIILKCADAFSASKIDTRAYQINDRGNRHMYYHVDEEGRFKQKIMGIQFQAVFTSQIPNETHQRYILSRFRPRYK